MLYCDQVHNFDDFNSRFGYKKDIKGNYLVNKNGVRQRKNNIVYQYFKESFLNLYKVHHDLKFAFEKAIKLNTAADVFNEMCQVVFKQDASNSRIISGFGEYVLLNDGICLDGNTTTSVRYKRGDHIYKMKIGKYVNKAIDYRSSELFWANNPILRIFFTEEITERWKQARLKEASLHIVVDTDFEKSYSSNTRPDGQENFNSCMDDHDNWNFYSTYPELFKTVRLEDSDGLVYARAILVNCKSVEDDSKHTYLERIYCNKRAYKDLMFAKAKEEGIFDLYKDLDASCHESTRINDLQDNKIKYDVYIKLNLDNGDYMSYQDTFKYYDTDSGKAYNTCNHYTNYNLDTTETYVHPYSDDDDE